MKYLLTIAIPTYNRANYLDRCLRFLTPQISEMVNNIEIIISDNGSTDNTDGIISKYNKTTNIKYLKNEVNLGMDYNFKKCFESASGDYVWLFSDDDVLYHGSLNIIVGIIKKYNPGMIHMKHNYISDNLSAKSILIDNADISVHNSPSKFLREMSHYISYISGNVVKNNYNYSDENINRYVGSFLIHVPIFLSVCYHSKVNIIVHTPMLAMQTDNSGGYNLLKTFGAELPCMIMEYDPNISNVIKKELIRSSFPNYLFLERISGNSNAENIQTLKSLSNTVLISCCIVPILRLPIILAKYYLKFLNASNKILKILNNTKIKKIKIR